MIPHDHSDTGEQVARYLGAMGIVRSFDERQDTEGPLPSIFEPRMLESPGPAVSVRVVNVDQDYFDSNPLVTIQTTIRSAPWDIEGLIDLAGLVWVALHRREEVFELTAGRQVVYSERAQPGATVPDGDNRRYARTDTYVLRVAPPRISVLKPRGRTLNLMANFAAAPNSCELGKSVNGNWAVQIKPVGSAPSEYRFVRGASSVNAIVTTNTVDASDIDSGGWDSTLKTTRNLAINIEGSYIQIPDLGILDETLELLKVSGEELGNEGKIDARVWRTDVDEGWEGTFNNNFTPNAGARGDLRSYTSALTNTCAPTRIHSVEEGSETAESVPMEEDYVKGILTPTGGGTGGGGEG